MYFAHTTSDRRQHQALIWHVFFSISYRLASPKTTPTKVWPKDWETRIIPGPWQHKDLVPEGKSVHCLLHQNSLAMKPK